MKDKTALIRIVKTPEGEIVIDTVGRKNGRGAYLCRSAECLAKVRKSHALDRAFKEHVPETVYQKLEEDFGHIE